MSGDIERLRQEAETLRTEIRVCRQILYDFCFYFKTFRLQIRSFWRNIVSCRVNNNKNLPEFSRLLVLLSIQMVSVCYLELSSV